MRLPSFLKRKIAKADIYMLQGGKIIQIPVSKPIKIPTPPKKKREHNKLTREEMWELIQAKHKFLKNFNVTPRYMSDIYIKRDEIWNFFVELELHTSSRLTNKQKEKVKREIIARL